MQHDTIVIGLGGIGSAVLYHLARRGQRVLGIDAHGIAHDHGSSHGETRIIRKAYFEHPDYVPLLHHAYESWERLQQETGTPLMRTTGLLCVGTDSGEVIPGILRAAHEHRLTMIEVEPRDVGKRCFHGFTLPENHRALFDPQGGLLHVEACVEAHCHRAAHHSAELCLHEAVTAWSSDSNGVSVTTTGGIYHAKSLILCPGPWASSLLQIPNLPLTVLRKVQMWWPLTDIAYRADRGCPVFAYELDGHFFYGFPSLDGQALKVAEHTGEEVVDDPRLLDRQLHPSDIQPVASFLQRCLPGITPIPDRHSVCMYTMTTDKHFIVDGHPHHDNVWFAAGFSGHGFKFAPAIGEALADWVIEGTTPLPIGFLSLNNRP